MANRYPYISSGGLITQAVIQLRKSFPPVVDSDTLKKLSIAPSNESYLINILRFIGLIDKSGAKISEKAKVFVLHDENEFQEKFSELIKESYSELFELRGDDAWVIDNNALINFFRQSDESTEIVGKRQASTFATLAVLAGKRTREVASNRSPKPTNPTQKQKKATGQKQKNGETQSTAINNGSSEVNTPVALTVRLEINLPAQADQDTYDRIFRSLRANFLNG